MPKGTKLLWPIVLLLAALTLSACVRPYPQPEPAAASEDANQFVPTTAPVPPPVQPEITPLPPVETEPTPEEVQEPTPEPLPTAEPQVDSVHVVAAGDTLFLIASQYGSSIEAIAAANALEDINRLEIGQELIIPAPGSEVEPAPEGETPDETEQDSVEESTGGAQENPGVHVVAPGENLYRIGLSYGCTVQQMARANNIPNPTYLSVGQELIIPDCSG